MSRTLKFCKMHGAGNDFVMVDARDLVGLDLAGLGLAGLQTESKLDPTRIAAICDRRTGVGADGLIIIEKAAGADSAFRMIYFNADGHEAEMCGNGARCSVAFAQAAGLSGENCFFETYSGVLAGTVFGPDDIQVSLPPWKDLALALDLGSTEFPELHTCNTGVPHLVVVVPDVELVDVLHWGRLFRHQEQFSPAGTNVNFVSRNATTGQYFLRTYERGVEDETLACGTGASATAVVLCNLGLAESPVTLHTRGGDELQVSVDFEDRKLLLRGPAETSFRGEVLIHD